MTTATPIDLITAVNTDTPTRNRLRRAMVKASTDNGTEEPSPRQIFEALVSLDTDSISDEVWAELLAVVLSVNS